MKTIMVLMLFSVVSLVSAEEKARTFDSNTPERKPASIDRPKENEMKQADIEKIRELKKVVQKILISDKF